MTYTPETLRRYVARVQIATYLKSNEPGANRTRYGATGMLHIRAHSVDEAIKQIGAFKHFDPDVQSSNGATFLFLNSIAPHVLEVHGAFYEAVFVPGKRTTLEAAMCEAAMFFLPDAEKETP